MRELPSSDSRIKNLDAPTVPSVCFAPMRAKPMPTTSLLHPCRTVTDTSNGATKPQCRSTYLCQHYFATVRSDSLIRQHPQQTPARNTFRAWDQVNYGLAGFATAHRIRVLIARFRSMFPDQQRTFERTSVSEKASTDRTNRSDLCREFEIFRIRPQRIAHTYTRVFSQSLLNDHLQPCIRLAIGNQFDKRLSQNHQKTRSVVLNLP